MDSHAFDRVTKQFIESTKGGKPIYEHSVQEARKILDTVQKNSSVEKPAVRIEEADLPCGPSGNVSVRIVRPSSRDDHSPVIVYFHGGGWILGNKETHDRLIGSLSLGAQATIVFVNYTPSPEAHFPIAIEEGLAVMKYVSQNGNKLHVNSSRMAVAGDSVGGNMATVVALMAIESGIKLCCQALFYPVTDANFNTPSYNQYAEGPWLTKAAMEWFWNAYAPHASERKNWKVSPLHAPLELLKTLPPTLVITDENDVLRDEGEAYAHRLIQAGVEVTAVRFLGTIHDFMMLNGLSKSPAAKGAIQLASSFLSKLVHKG